MKIDPVEIAGLAQYAENNYFGKPCGLMDQMACSVGGLIHIDFNEPKAPIVNKIDVDFDTYHYSLVYRRYKRVSFGSDGCLAQIPFR